ncbi:hypothetical protein ABZ137_31090 [Streptomyces bobili]|uniref:hypothetical protein n=1 Tax=Streptomyces bobili TaxID=67280 RepID=UPI0033A94F57
MGISVVAATTATFLVLLFDSLAAFAFAKYAFPGQRVLFWIVLATFIIPMQLALVQQFITLPWLGWVGSLKALVIPGAANAFGIFWMRQYAQGAIADELIQASMVDGSGFDLPTPAWLTAVRRSRDHRRRPRAWSHPSKSSFRLR